MQVGELIVLSHVRWTWLWQRPQQIVSRLAEGRRTWFVEAPRVANVAEPRLVAEAHGPVTRVWLEAPAALAGIEAVAETYARLLPDFLGSPSADGRAVWLTAPEALPVVDALGGDVLVYDVMEHRASAAHEQALERADVVFTAGPALHEAVLRTRPERTHLFVSGVDPEHYTLARQKRRPARRPVAGHLGVVDGRLDLGLLAAVADALPDWEIRLVGPVVALDRAELPERANITFAGACSYDEVPDVLSGFDVGLLPYLVDDAAGATGTTGALEYLAAGLPVVTTRLPDVEAACGNLVEVVDTSAEFADAVARARDDDPARRARKARPVLHWHHWDTITARMERHMTGVTPVSGPATGVGRRS